MDGNSHPFARFADATDRPYASAAAQRASLRHAVIETSLEGVLEHMPWVIAVLKSFDPMTLRNSAAVAMALRHASELGCTCAVTGDGADELFGGYAFTQRLEDAAWLEQRSRMSAVRLNPLCCAPVAARNRCFAVWGGVPCKFASTHAFQNRRKYHVQKVK